MDGEVALPRLRPRIGISMAAHRLQRLGGGRARMAIVDDQGDTSLPCQPGREQPRDGCPRRRDFEDRPLRRFAEGGRGRRGGAPPPPPPNETARPPTPHPLVAPPRPP